MGSYSKHLKPDDSIQSIYRCRSGNIESYKWPKRERFDCTWCEEGTGSLLDAQEVAAAGYQVGVDEQPELLQFVKQQQG